MATQPSDGFAVPFPGFSKPNYTQVPDELFDRLMPFLSDAELRVLLYLIRRTFGFKKEADAISLKQMVEGIQTADGRILDHGTGLSKATVARGLAGLRKKGIIKAERNRSRERGDEATTYSLRFRDDPVPPCLSSETGGGVSSLRQGVSQQRDTQHTVRQETEKSSNFESSRADILTKDEVIGRSGAGQVAENPLSDPEMTLDERFSTEQGNGSSAAPTPLLDVSRASEGHSHNAPAATGEHGYHRFRESALHLRDELAQEPRARQRRSSSIPTPVGDILRGRSEPSAVPAPVATPQQPFPVSHTTKQRGRPPGSGEDREHLAAFLHDFGIQLGDTASLSSTITRAYNLLTRAGVPPERWGDVLYQARAITQEHSGQIKTKASADSLRPRPKMGYFFAVVADLIGLKPDPETPPARDPTVNETSAVGDQLRPADPPGSIEHVS